MMAEESSCRTFSFYFVSGGGIEVIIENEKLGGDLVGLLSRIWQREGPDIVEDPVWSWLKRQLGGGGCLQCSARV